MKVAVTDEERSLSYYRFYEREMAEVPEKLWQRTLEDAEKPEELLPFVRRSDFVRGSDEAFCQSGFGCFEDGTAAVCSRLYMPGVSPQMLDWWFPWHSVGSDLRYKIWDPEDHYFATAYPASKVLDSNVPTAQKTWGVDHYIMEDVGFGPQFVQIRFVRPADVGCDEQLIGSDNCAGLVCGIGINTGTTMIHKWYPYQDGVIFQSRFWIGWGYLPDGSLGKCLPDEAAIPEAFARAMFAHSLKEYINLASFLPELYQEEKGKENSL